VTQAKALSAVRDSRQTKRTLLVAARPVDWGARLSTVMLALAETHPPCRKQGPSAGLAWPGGVVEEKNLTVQSRPCARSGHDAIVTITAEDTGQHGDSAQAPPCTCAAREETACVVRLQRRLAVIVRPTSSVGRGGCRDAMIAAVAWKRIRVELIERPAPRRRPGHRIDTERIPARVSSAVEAVAGG